MPGARGAVEDVMREWFEQALVETVLGVQSLKESRLWPAHAVAEALSEEALTAAVMPRCLIDLAIKKALENTMDSVKKATNAAHENNLSTT